MKRTLLKIGNIASYGAITLGSIASVSAFLYGVLPTDITQPVITAISLNKEAIMPVGVASLVTTGTITTAKLMLKSLAEKLHQSNLSLRVWETEQENKIANRFQLQEQLNDTVVAKQNEILEQNKVLIAQQNALIKFNEITAVRNIASPLVPNGVKDEYKTALGSLTTLNANYKPITKVVEEIIYKEVEVEKDNKVSW